MNSEEYCIRVLDLPLSVKAMVSYDAEGFPNVYVNARLSRDEQQRAVEHELRHIAGDDVYSDENIRSIEA